MLSTGEAVANGVAETKLAAQVAAQRAHEAWLHRKRNSFDIPTRFSYDWEEVE
jgi:thiamine biosynthesis protein ThiC